MISYSVVLDGSVFEIVGALLIGSDPGMPVCISGDGVAPQHAVLEWAPDGVLLRNLHSGLETRVNDRLVERKHLRAGDQIRIGTVKLQIRADDESSGTATSGVRVVDSNGVTVEVVDPEPYLDSNDSATCDDCGRRFGRSLLAVDMQRLCPECANLHSDAHARSPAGRTVGSYELLRVIGEGATGTVYEGRHRMLGIRAAVKILHPSLVVHSGLRRRFLREQKAMAVVVHPCIVRCIEFGTLGEQLYLAAEYVAGGVASQFSSATSDIPVIAGLGADIFDGLAAIHDAGYIHRDIKPCNILVHGDANAPRAKIGDFGMVGYLQRARITSLTTDGGYGGTLWYTSPEQLLDFKTVDRGADFYSAAACLYELLTGSLPLAIAGAGYGGGVRDGAGPAGSSALDAIDETDLLLAIAEEPRVPIRERRNDIPSSLAELIDSLVALSAERRDNLQASAIADALRDHALKRG